MTGRQSFFARALLALVLVAAGVATAAAQTVTITARTPSRGGLGGGTTVEVLGTGFVQGVTNVAMSPANAAQPTSVTIHSGTRLTFVTPPRTVPGNYADHRQHLHAVRHPAIRLRRANTQRHGRRPQAGFQLRRTLRRLRVPLRPDARRHQRPGRHLRAEQAERRRAPRQHLLGRRAGPRRREHQPGDQRQRPLHRVPIVGQQPGRRRHQRLCRRLPARSRRRRRRHLRRSGCRQHRARQHRRVLRRVRGRPRASAATASIRPSAATAVTLPSNRQPRISSPETPSGRPTSSCSTGRGGSPGR